jgi:hypothetical protein
MQSMQHEPRWASSSARKTGRLLRELGSCSPNWRRSLPDRLSFGDDARRMRAPNRRLDVPDPFVRGRSEHEPKVPGRYFAEKYRTIDEPIFQLRTFVDSPRHPSTRGRESQRCRCLHAALLLSPGDAFATEEQTVTLKSSLPSNHSLR